MQGRLAGAGMTAVAFTPSISQTKAAARCGSRLVVQQQHGRRSVPCASVARRRPENRLQPLVAAHLPRSLALATQQGRSLSSAGHKTQRRALLQGVRASGSSGSGGSEEDSQQQLQRQGSSKKGGSDEQVIDALIFEEDTAMVAERAFERAALYVGAAFAFGAVVWLTMGATAGYEYFAGYLLEQSLSVDNLFVFILVFRFFKTPVEAQRKALFWGILTAAVLRGVMIGLGVELIQVFEPLLLVFAAILLFSSYKLLTSGDDDDDDDLSNNTVVKLCRRFIPVTDHYDGDRFLTLAPDGKTVLTPLVLVLAVIEISDVIFAVDSIPAVFGITLNPFVVYSSNIFAIISLRAFYSFVAVFIEKLRFLDKAVSLVLGFIGLKMVFDYFGLHLPTWAALVVVAGTLSAGVGASLLFPAPEEEGDKDDGSDDEERGGGGDGGSNGAAGARRGAGAASAAPSSDGEGEDERSSLLARVVAAAQVGGGGLSSRPSSRGSQGQEQLLEVVSHASGSTSVSVTNNSTLSAGRRPAVISRNSSALSAAGRRGSSDTAAHGAGDGSYPGSPAPA